MGGNELKIFQNPKKGSTVFFKQVLMAFGKEVLAADKDEGFLDEISIPKKQQELIVKNMEKLRGMLLIWQARQLLKKKRTLRDQRLNGQPLGNVVTSPVDTRESSCQTEPPGRRPPTGMHKFTAKKEESGSPARSRAVVKKPSPEDESDSLL